MKSLILKEVNKVTVIIIYMFGIYVILNGHISAGGGFAGGTIISAGMILDKMTRDKKEKKKITENRIIKVICSAIIVYAFMKGYHIFHSFFGHHTVKAVTSIKYPVIFGGQLVILNICVGIIVAYVFYSVVSLFMEGTL